MRDVKEPDVRRKEIMDAALLLFIEKGYINTTTQDIIDSARISRGLLYYHFKNKEDLLYYLIERHSEPLLSKLFNISYNDNKSAVSKIEEFIEATLISPTEITKEMIELQKVIDINKNQYLMDKFSHKLINKITIYFTDIINQGIAEGDLTVSYPSEIARLIMTGYVFTSTSINSLSIDSDVIGDRYINAFIELLNRTLKTNIKLLL